jgi:tetratricopeptide (TPR) repeat protein
LANALDGLGDLKGALKMQQASLAEFTQVGERRGISTTENNLGNLLVEMGSLEEAKKYFEQALATTREISYRRGEPYPIAGIGDALLPQGDLEGARQKFNEALALCKELNDEDFVAQLHVSLATVDLFEKKYSEGADLARQAVAGYMKDNSTGNAAWSQAVLSRNLLGDGKLAEATSAAEKALTLSHQSTDQTPRYEAAFADARVKAKSGNLAEARKELEAALASARKFGYRLYEYEARLTTGEIDLASGSPTAQAYLAALEKDARTNGALLIANEARALLSEAAEVKKG